MPTPLQEAYFAAVEHLYRHRDWGYAFVPLGVDPADAFDAARAADNQQPGPPGMMFLTGILTGIFYERAIREAIEDVTGT